MPPSPEQIDASVESARREALAQVRGNINERRVLVLMLRGPLPPWVASVRPGTRREDRRGIDIVVTCRDGEDYEIDVKSSEVGAVAYARECAGHPGQRGVIVANEGIHDGRLLGRARAVLTAMRHERVLARGGAL